MCELGIHKTPTVKVTTTCNVCIYDQRVTTGACNNFYDRFLQVGSCLTSSHPATIGLITTLSQVRGIIITRSIGPIPRVIRLLHIRTRTVQTRSTTTYHGVKRGYLSLLHPKVKVLARYGTNRLTMSRCKATLTPICLKRRHKCNFGIFTSRAHPLLRNTHLATCRLRGINISIALVYSGVTSAIVQGN